MNKKVLTAVVLGIVSSGYFSTISEAVMLDTAYVEADRIHDEYAGGFVDRGTDMGILGKQDYMSVPVQGLSVTANVIENIKLPNNTLSEAVTLSPSVRSRGGNAYNDISIRGFNISPHDYLLNGIPGLMCQSSIPTSFVERINIISGPSSLMEGSSSVGGTSVGGAVDIISKKAEDKPTRKFTETFSGRGTWEEAVDIGQRFGKEKAWGIRVNASLGKGITHRQKEDMTNGSIFFNLDYDKGNDKANFFYGHFHVNEFAPDLPLNLGKMNVPKPPDGSTNFQASWANYAYTNDILGLSYEHDFNEHLTWYLKGGYHDEDWYSCFESYYPTLQDDKGNYESYIEQVPIRLYRKSFITGIKGDFMTGKVKHNLSLSFEKQWYSGWWGDWAAGYDYLYHGNIYDNSIEKFKKPIVDRIDWGKYKRQTSSGVSFIDTIEAGKLVAMLGIRHQHDKTEKSYDGSANSPSIGLTYKVTPEFSVYGNWMESVIPGVTVGAKYANKGEVLDPSKTKQSEFGVKWDRKNIGGTISYFNIHEQLPMVDPKTNIYGYNGQQKSKGIEFTLFGEPVKGLHVLGGISNMLVKNIGGTYDGKRYHGAPRWMGTLALQYDITSRFSLTSRITYNSYAWADDNNKKKIKPWTRLDLGAKYSWNDRRYPVTLSCNVINVLNHRYWYGAGNNSVYLGTPRTFVVSLGMDF